MTARFIFVNCIRRNIYVNDSDIRFGQGLETPVSERDELSIVPAVAGGRS
ncbi:MAG: MoaD/ThiS family protein [Candidatus Dormibacteraeota bacterium]|nr:MoaD/ThiS family protein [Candidatus Dormibacteraeota bacterium]